MRQKESSWWGNEGFRVPVTVKHWTASVCHSTYGIHICHSAFDIRHSAFAFAFAFGIWYLVLHQTLNGCWQNALSDLPHAALFPSLLVRLIYYSTLTICNPINVYVYLYPHTTHHTPHTHTPPFRGGAQIFSDWDLIERRQISFVGRDEILKFNSIESENTEANIAFREPPKNLNISSSHWLVMQITKIVEFLQWLQNYNLNSLSNGIKDTNFENNFYMKKFLEIICKIVLIRKISNYVSNFRSVKFCIRTAAFFPKKLLVFIQKCGF